MAKKIKKKPERKLRLIKKEADSWFSLYIRLKNSDWRGYTTCYTCGHVSHYKKGMQCGHFASRRFLNTRFDEENVRVQCMACNMFKKGNMNVYAEKLIEENGADFIAEINKKADIPSKADRAWWLEKLDYYKKKVKTLDNYKV